jgi:hypothetical protein
VLLVVVAGIAYLMVAQPLAERLASTPSPTPTPVPSPTLPADNSAAVGASAPLSVASEGDLAQAEAALEGDPSLSVSELDQEIAGLE